MVIASVYKWEKEKLDKKGQNEDLASPVIVALRRGITELRVGNVQVISESDPNPHTEIRKTLCEPASSQSLAPSRAVQPLLLSCQDLPMLLAKGQEEAVEMI